MCSMCQAITEGRALDIIEIDAASNRGIDDIRQIKEEIKMHPVYGNVKYVIIDEAHSLTGFAAEAALKMIEEPPKGVRFILATTDAHKMFKPLLNRSLQGPCTKNRVITLVHNLFTGIVGKLSVYLASVQTLP